jgi:hypothetical protein
MASVLVWSAIATTTSIPHLSASPATPLSLAASPAIPPPSASPVPPPTTSAAIPAQSALLSPTVFAAPLPPSAWSALWGSTSTETTALSAAVTVRLAKIRPLTVLAALGGCTSRATPA